MPAIREVTFVAPGRPTVEGAGVHLRRAFGFGLEREFDPFLLLDDLDRKSTRLNSSHRT